MNYRNLGKLKNKVSILGLGAMRLPVIEGDNRKIDEVEAIKMIRYALDNGINYVDTAWPYHEGNSEAVVGKALADGYRNKTYLATKLPTWMVSDKNDFDSILNQQLVKLNTNRIDYYLLHSLNRSKWEKVKGLGVLEWAESKIKDGLIGQIGFSFHDEYEVFDEIIRDYDWDFCQIQYNYLDINFQAGARGLKLATEKGVSVAIMEPLRGGKLARAPQEIIEMWNQADRKRPLVEWALDWLWSQKGVTLALSGMSNLEQVKENIEYANRAESNKLNEKEMKLVDRVARKIKELSPIPCTRCRYCMPCAMGVNIPRIFEIYNDGVSYKNMDEAKEKYNKLEKNEKISNCIGCGKCEVVCPQSIEIRSWLKKIDVKLTL